MNTIDYFEENSIPKHVQLIMLVRMYGSFYSEMTRLFGESLSLKANEALALTEILFAEDLGSPLTPAKLAHRLGLTSGATSLLIDRLERAKYVERSRESKDRRLVFLKTTSAIQQPAINFFSVFTRHTEQFLEEYSKEEVDTYIHFMQDMWVSMQKTLDSTYR